MKLPTPKYRIGDIIKYKTSENEVGYDKIMQINTTMNSELSNVSYVFETYEHAIDEDDILEGPNRTRVRKKKDCE